MDSDCSEGADDSGNSVKASARPDSSKKCRGKVPRKIHKAAREKLKRDQLNELFSELGKALDLEHPNNGKASILRETTRLLGELLAQVDNLKKEQTTLLSESNYVMVERNELQEETCALNAEIKRLEREIDERANGSNLDAFQPQCNTPSQLPEGHVAFPVASNVSDPTPVVGPVFVMPLHHESEGFCGALHEMNMTKGLSNVSRPQARYPSSADSWPSHILTKQTNVVEDA
ncbi:protein IRON-RELATED TRANSCRIPTION FACTOR 3-like [Andrographis paniculata]|uniref:protein IRON-RELATED TRANSCRIPTION FACTOR 3-like n=1 Tax=Andrographis paniculata TaxID=175694 RepID=UPI0021E70C90|nr:protein IRON-RELATED TRANSCRIPTION FACTOR 3-like [Andrographis paniculata]XP_051120777.1 protein IRON-RELATED TRANSCRIPTION FACTOR 3-like [Andrographis paniculata]